MAWTARKVNPRTENRLFKIDVEYLRDGKVDHVKTYETSQAQPDNWPAEIVKRHIRSLIDLETLPAVITDGDVTIPADTVIDTPREAWMEDYAKAKELKHLVELGVIPADDPKYVALRARLKPNFRMRYIGLI